MGNLAALDTKRSYQILLLWWIGVLGGKGKLARDLYLNAEVMGMHISGRSRSLGARGWSACSLLEHLG